MSLYSSNSDQLTSSTSATAASGGGGGVAMDQSYGSLLQTRNTFHSSENMYTPNSDATRVQHRGGGDGRGIQSDDDDDDDDDSGSSLNEEEIRDIVRHVLVMVKHNRQSTSQATTSREASRSVTSTNHGGSRYSSIERHDQPPQSDRVASFVAPQVAWGRGGRESPAIVATETGAGVGVGGGGVNTSYYNNPNKSRSGSTNSMLRSTNIDTYASLLGIRPRSRNTTPDPAPQLQHAASSRISQRAETSAAENQHPQFQQQQQQQQQLVQPLPTIPADKHNSVSQEPSPRPSTEGSLVSNGAIRFSKKTPSQSTTGANAVANPTTVAAAHGTTTSPSQQKQQQRTTTTQRHHQNHDIAAVGGDARTPQQEDAKNHDRRHHHHHPVLDVSATTDDSSTEYMIPRTRDDLLGAVVMMSQHPATYNHQQHQPQHLANEFSRGHTEGKFSMSLSRPQSVSSSFQADDQHLSLERRRVERLQRVRAEVLRDETFTPRTNNPPAYVPDNLRTIPQRPGNHWEDRLYTEYLSRKKRKQLENEALRIAKQTQHEIQEALEDCSFAPDVRGIHDTMREWKQRTASSSSEQQQQRSNNNNTVAVSSAARAAEATMRLFSASAQTKEERDAIAQRMQDEARLAEEQRQRKLMMAKPSPTQLRLYRDREAHDADRRRLQEEFRAQQKARSYVFNIKTCYYETMPLPTHADPGAFQRLYDDNARRDERRTQAQQEALLRRATPTPQITEYAKRRVHSAQPVHERLAAAVTAAHHRSVSPGTMPPGGASTTRGCVVKQQHHRSTQPAQTSTTNVAAAAAAAATAAAAQLINVAGTDTSPVSPLHSDALHSLSLQPGARAEYIISWMGRSPNSISRQDSLKDATRGPPQGTQSPGTRSPDGVERYEGQPTPPPHVGVLRQNISPPPAATTRVLSESMIDQLAVVSSSESHTHEASEPGNGDVPRVSGQQVSQHPNAKSYASTQGPVSTKLSPSTRTGSKRDAPGAADRSRRYSDLGTLPVVEEVGEDDDDDDLALVIGR